MSENADGGGIEHIPDKEYAAQLKAMREAVPVLEERLSRAAEALVPAAQMFDLASIAYAHASTEHHQALVRERDLRRKAGEAMMARAARGEMPSTDAGLQVAVAVARRALTEDGQSPTEVALEKARQRLEAAQADLNDARQRVGALEGHLRLVEQTTARLESERHRARVLRGEIAPDPVPAAAVPQWWPEPRRRERVGG